MSEANIISADHPALPGHFPGRPIVPGVVLVEQLMAEFHRQHPGVAPAGIKRLKFTRALLPEQAFAVTWGQLENGGVRFRVHRGQELIAEGQFLLA